MARSTLENKRPCFLGEGEVGVYLGHLMAGLKFPIDPDLLAILEYYDLPLCRYSLVSIGCMVGFLSLLCQKRLPFSIYLFHHFFGVRVLGCNDFASVEACQNKKIIMGIPQKYRNWHT